MLTFEPVAFEHRETGIRVRIEEKPGGWCLSWSSYARSGALYGLANYSVAVRQAEALYPELEVHAATQEAEA